MSPVEIKRFKGAGYEVELPNTKFSSDFATKKIILPADKTKTPKIIRWAGPARSGTTSLLFLLAGHKDVSGVFFQPIKTILREGGPTLDLSAAKGTICLKEVMRSCCSANNHDPIKILLDAGVPAKNITWISMLRDPQQNYASWTKHIVGSQPEDYADAQDFTVKLYDHYKKLGLNITPFAYDLLQLGEERVVNALFNKLGIEPLSTLDFKQNIIGRKMYYGQASDPNYFKMSVQPTLDRKKFIYTKHQEILPSDAAKKIRELCQKRYDDFFEMSRLELGV